jgi:hypothetical protein
MKISSRMPSCVSPVDSDSATSAMGFAMGRSPINAIKFLNSLIATRRSAALSMRVSDVWIGSVVCCSIVVCATLSAMPYFRLNM